MTRFVAILTSALLVSLISVPATAQSTASIQGRVADHTGAVVAGAQIMARNHETGLARFVATDEAGDYLIAALPVGTYRLRIQASGFQTQIVEKIVVEVARSIVQDFELHIGDIAQQMIVTSAGNLLERATVSVGHVTDKRMVQDIPLNGRYFLDLGLLVPGSVTSPQGAFSGAPMRGLGSLAINTSGNREEAVNYMINGITLNNETFSSISFQPSVNSIQEFRVDNSTFSAEYGQNSGAIVNIATRSGANDFHGELYEFLRNDALDARNFFNFTSTKPPPFKRNQFGGHFGGPIVQNKAFFLFSYEGMRQRQGLDLNSLVLSDSQRASATNPVINRLIQLVPRANFLDSSGNPRFVSSASAPVNVDSWTIDINYSPGERDRLHGYYALQRVRSSEPTRTGNTIAGFGNDIHVQRQIFTFNENHIFSPSVVNEARFGFNRWLSSQTPVAQLNPAEFGINNGISDPIGLPQINVAGGALNFGGPANQPSGRGDTNFVVSDTLNVLTGRHSIKLGGEFRKFLNNNFRRVTGSFNFPSVEAFITGTANSFNITLGNQSSSIAQGALGFFLQDSLKVGTHLTFELGLRYEWNMTPTERYDRFIVFDPASASLLQVGKDIDVIYRQNNKNFQPRLGFSWDPFRGGKTVIRGAYAILTDQPMTSIVTGTSANPPLAVPLTFSGQIRFDNAISLASAAGLAPQTIDHKYNNAYVQSWNLNVQRELTRNLALMIGYVGSKGTNLVLRRDINQPVNGVRPFAALSTSSPVLPGTALGNITQVESTGNSSYHALWVTASQRLAHGLQFSTSYTLSKSLDYNSFSTGGIVGQNSYDLRSDRGLSDFDARHRFVFSGICELPFKGSQLVEGWQLAAIIQMQTGNPLNIVTSNVGVNGVANTLRPDVIWPIRIIGDVERWFDTSVFAPVGRPGNLGRNVIIGPGFNNIDFSVIKNTYLNERMRLEFRAEIFDLFNHANLGQPGNVVGTPAFGRITNTRFPTGESGSSRQIQFALKLAF